MTDIKITALTAASAVTADDVFEMVNDPAGTPVSQQATAAQITTYVNSTLSTNMANNAETLTWSAGTAPGIAGSIDHTYSWSKTGRMVTITGAIIATPAGATVTQVSFPLPSALPTPIEPTGTSGAGSRIHYFGSGRMATSLTSTGAAGASWIRSNSGDNGYELGVTASSGSHTRVDYQISYEATS